jgi:hypothetical protein
MIVAFFSASAAAQKTADLQIVDSGQTLLCDGTSGFYDSFIQGVPVNKNIIIIGYTGQDDKSDTINLHRLQRAKNYILETYKESRFARSEETIIMASGIGKRKEGELVFYVDAERQLVMRFRKDRRLRVHPCYTGIG